MAVDPEQGPAHGWTWEETPVTPAAAPERPSDATGAAMVTAGKAVPAATDAALAFATSPSAAATAGKLANGVTTISSIAHGDVFGAPIKGWAAGKGGYFLAKGAQDLAAPVAAAMEKAAPYAQALSTVGGAQGLLDLVQMADPKRKDLGFLGVSLNDPHDPEHPALVNAAMHYVLSKLDGWQWSKMKNLVMQQGLDELSAVKQVLSK